MKALETKPVEFSQQPSDGVFCGFCTSVCLHASQIKKKREKERDRDRPTLWNLITRFQNHSMLPLTPLCNLRVTKQPAQPVVLAMLMNKKTKTIIFCNSSPLLNIFCPPSDFFVQLLQCISNFSILKLPPIQSSSNLFLLKKKILTNYCESAFLFKIAFFGGATQIQFSRVNAIAF